MEGLVYDNLKWAKDKEILTFTNKEILYYSNKIIKINHFGLNQDRNLVLTDEALYNFHKKKLKRRIKYNQIRGITFSKQNYEFIIHGNDEEYDYFYQSNERSVILSFITKFYEEQNNQTLKLCEINEKTLKNYVTGKKEKKKDKNFSKMDESKKINTKQFLEENSKSIKKLLSSSLNNLEEEKIDDEVPIKIKPKIIFNKIDHIQNVILEDFKILKILGRGTFGKVYLVQYKNEKEYYAMKSIKKEYLIEENEIQKILIVKNFLQNLSFPFLIGTLLCFVTEDRIYFIMNLIEGENLSNYMMNNKNIQEDQVKFYAAIIGLTIDYLHKNGIKIRHLHPDDIIIDKDGYLKIPDFKLGKLFSLNNNFLITTETSEYLSPEEIIPITKKKTKTEPQSDWWTYGIIIYELLYGIPPYFNEDDNEIRTLITKNDLKFPINTVISKNAKELIKKLLNKNPDSRLGHSNGFDDIKKQDFFKGFNFDNLINKTIIPKYKPTVGDILKEKEKRIEVTYDDLINCKIIK